MAEQITKGSKERVLKLLGLLSTHDRHVLQMAIRGSARTRRLTPRAVDWRRAKAGLAEC